MAVEIAGTFLHWSQPPPPRGSISHNTVTLAISSLLYTTSRNSLIHKSVHHSVFLGAALLNHTHRRGRGRGGRRWRGSDSSSASLDDFVEGGKNEEEFVRPNELNLNFDIESELQRNRDAETSNRCDESAPSRDEIPSISPASDLSPALPISVNPEIRFSDQIPAFPISIYPEIPAMPPESWSDSDEFDLEELERIPNSFDLPLSLRILQRKKNHLQSTETEEDSAYSSVKRAFSSMVFIVRELQIHAIRMREALFSFDNFQIQGILARVHDELHASFVWLFHRIFSSTPTLMVYLMLLLANFTVFSITDQHAIAATPLPPLRSVSTIIEESNNNYTKQFDASAIKTISSGRSAVVGGGGIGGGKPPAISGAADDGHLDRSSSSLCYGGAISPSMEAIDEDTAVMAWRRILKEAETIRASGRHEALMDSETLQRFVSPVTVEAEPEDFSVYSATELSYLISLADNPDDVLLLSNFAQFLYTVFRDHDRAEEYFKRALRAEPADAETLNRYANFLWVARKDLGAAEETFLEAISADPQNTYYSANYAHFLWSTGGHDTCYPLGDCGVDDT